MTINITSKHIEVTAAIQAHITASLKKLTKLQAVIITPPHIVLSKEPDGFAANATISINKALLVASAKDKDLYFAINKLASKLERQLKKIQHKPEALRTDKTSKLPLIAMSTIDTEIIAESTLTLE